MISPISIRELGCDNFLHDIARHGVEDVEESFVGEARNAGLERVDVLYRVAGWECVVLFKGSGRHRVGEWRGEVLVEGSDSHD